MQSLPSTRRYPPLAVLLAVLLAAVAIFTFAACSDKSDAPGDAALQLPQAEFLLAAGDSTWWVKSSAVGLRVRSAPILLTTADGRMFEVFLTGEDSEYRDASFASARLWSRDLRQSDSVLLFADSTVVREHASWRRRNPREMQIDPDDAAMQEDPYTSAQDDIEIVDVHGPFLTFEHLLDVDIDGGAKQKHLGRRFVVDVRSGKRPGLTELFGKSEADMILSQARSSMNELLDSIRVAGYGGDERASEALETLDSFVLNEHSFGLTDIERGPAVAFMVPGNGLGGEALALNLPPIGTSEPAWWAPVHSSLPEWMIDSSAVVWDRGGYTVAARRSSRADVLDLALMPGAVRNESEHASGRAKRREWPIAGVGMPVHQLIPLDSPYFDDAARAALSRMFDISTAEDDYVQSVLNRRKRSSRTKLLHVIHRITGFSHD